MRAVLQLPMFKEILPRVLEVPRRLAHKVASWFLVQDFYSKRTEERVNENITAAFVDPGRR